VHSGLRRNLPISGRYKAEGTACNIYKSSCYDSEDDRKHKPAIDMRQKGQTKDIEADVFMEERIGDAERSGVGKQQEILPLAGPV